MTAIRLSICIPTYNFGPFLGATLSSIISQATDEVEILVVDGASTDDTADIVLSYQQGCALLRYELLERKGGIDVDIARTVALARGTYCWLFSADDVMDSHALSKMLHEIRSGHDIYLCNRKETDINLKPLGVRYYLDEKVEDRVFDLANGDDLSDYLDHSTSIAALFSYMSSIVFLREKWNFVNDSMELMGTSYHHVYKLLSFIKYGCRLKYLREPLVTCRLGNDSFTGTSLARRALIDVDGYTLIMTTCFAESAEAKGKFRDALVRDFKRTHLNSVTRLLRLKLCSQKDDWVQLKEKLRRFCGFNVRLFLVNFIPYTPVWRRTVKAIKKLGHLS